jgi:hypothetical protein
LRSKARCGDGHECGNKDACVHTTRTRRVLLPVWVNYVLFTRGSSEKSLGLAWMSRLC